MPDSPEMPLDPPEPAPKRKPRKPRAPKPPEDLYIAWDFKWRLVDDPITFAGAMSKYTLATTLPARRQSKPATAAPGDSRDGL